MKNLRLCPIAIALALGCAAGTAQAQVASCASVTANNATGIYNGAVLNIDGNISVTCTYVSGARNQTLYLGINNGEGGTVRNLTRQSAANTLAYLLLRPNNYVADWTTAAGRNTTNNTDGGLNLTFNFNTANTLTQNYVYRFRVAAGTAPAAGVYDDSTIGVFVRQTNNTGAIRASTTFIATVSVIAQCRFTSAPTALTMNYTSFAAAASTGTSNFAVTCTQSTPYTLALDATSGTLLGLNYTLGLSAAGATGTAFAQNFTVNGSIAAGQAGTCATANCSATQARTLTITY
ncbi:MAG: spore coat protein U domain-containing protein [Burkholderiales bacterium]